VSSTVVITGASQGIGAAIAHEFAKQLNDKGEACFRLALVARNAQSLKLVSQECRELGGVAEYFPCDLTQEDQVNTMAQDVRDSMGVPELLINNAGQFVRDNLLTMDLHSFRATIDANLTSAFLVTRAFVQSMMNRKRGTIFYMASVASQRAYPNCGAYTVAKHGLLGLARAVRESTQDAGLRVTAILPGATDTPSWQGSGIDSQRLMPARDVAQSLLSIYRLSQRSVVEEIVLRPVRGDI